MAACFFTFTCPLALALAKTDMWEGHAGQTQANPFGFHYLSACHRVIWDPGYLVERIAICARRVNLGYLRLQFRTLARESAHVVLQNTPNNQFFLQQCLTKCQEMLGST